MRVPLLLSDGLVHEVMHNETQHVHGQVMCQLYYTGHEKHIALVRNELLLKIDVVDGWESVTCIQCVSRTINFRRKPRRRRKKGS